MAHQVFLSYATEDIDTARLLCRALEQEEGIRCWIAPRDVEAGTDYAAAILDAIKDSALVLLLFSSHANASPYVLREIERAVAYERPVVSLRLDGTPPSSSLEYYLNLWQWLDVPRGIESRRPEIVAAVRKQLGAARRPPSSESSEFAAASAPASAAPTPAPPPAASPDVGRSEGERKFATVLVAGVADFAALSERLDPEALHDLVTACFERLVLSIEPYGGTVDRSGSDAIAAFFGAPKAHENDPERALRAALDMREGLASFNKRRPVPVTIQFGVNTGLVYAGGVGSGERRDYSVMGETVSVAVRLKDLAKPGEILVGPDTYRQTENLFAWQPASRTQAKGKSQTLAAYRLLEAHPEPPAQGRRHTRGFTSPFVGRESELASLTGCLARLRAGEGGVVLVTGEAGLGKSRLVAEMQARAQRERIAWLEGHALSFGRTISYWPLLEIIQTDAGIESDDSEGERWAKLAARVGALFGEERNEILPYLGTLLSIPVPEELAQKVRYLDGEAMGHQIYRATRLFFSRVARERPTVVVFEDVHWLDGSSAALLEHLLPLTLREPILFFLVSRPEADSALTRLRELVRSEYADHLIEIALRPLSCEESATLVRNLAHLDELPGRLRDPILAKAEGNPFYVEEVVRSLIDQGGLVSEPATERYQVTEKAVLIPIPDTLQALVMARVDRLGEGLKQVLRLSSVIGRTFSYRLLESIAEADPELDHSLGELEAREFIREKARHPELEYIFEHALVQEATYENILLGRRKELHARVARAIETVFPDRVEEFYVLLAYHYSRAEEWARAQEYLFKAGDQAGSIAADAEALAHYEEAVEAYGLAFGDKWDPLERARVERKIGEAYFRRGEHEQSRGHFERAVALLGHPMPGSPRAVRRALIAEVSRQAWHRVRPWRVKPRWTDDSTSATLGELWKSGSLLGSIDSTVEPPRALYSILHLLNAAECAGWDQQAAFVSSIIVMVCVEGGFGRFAPYYIRRASELEPGLEDYLGGSLIASFAPSMYQHCLGEWDAAFAGFSATAALGPPSGEVRLSGAASCYRADILMERGRLQEALEVAQGVTRRVANSGDRISIGYGRLWEGEARNRMGLLGEAETDIRAAIDGLQGGLELMNTIMAYGFLAHCLIRQGRLEEALPIAEEYLGTASARRFSGLHSRGVTTARAHMLLVRAEEAGARDKKATMSAAGEACRLALKHGKGDRGGLLPAYRLQGTYEWLRGRRGAAEKWWQKSFELADELDARYERALTHLERGRRLGDRTALETAEAEFEAMGAQHYLAEARRLLGRAGDESVDPVQVAKD